MPPVGVDLIVLSEVGYYFQPHIWAQLTEATIASMQPGSTVLSVNWLGNSPDHRMSGDQTAEILAANPNLKLELAQRHESFRLERWLRA